VNPRKKNFCIKAVSNREIFVNCCAVGSGAATERGAVD
jgi:hypothetical protein